MPENTEAQRRHCWRRLVVIGAILIALATGWGASLLAQQFAPEPAPLPSASSYSHEEYAKLEWKYESAQLWIARQAHATGILAGGIALVLAYVGLDAARQNAIQRRRFLGLAARSRRERRAALARARRQFTQASSQIEELSFLPILPNATSSVEVRERALARWNARYVEFARAMFTANEFSDRELISDRELALLTRIVSLADLVERTTADLLGGNEVAPELTTPPEPVSSSAATVPGAPEHVPPMPTAEQTTDAPHPATPMLAPPADGAGAPPSLLMLPSAKFSLNPRVVAWAFPLAVAFAAVGVFVAPGVFTPRLFPHFPTFVPTDPNARFHATYPAAVMVSSLWFYFPTLATLGVVRAVVGAVRRRRAERAEIATTLTALALQYDSLQLEGLRLAVDAGTYSAQAERRFSMWPTSYVRGVRIANDPDSSHRRKLAAVRMLRAQAESLWRIGPILDGELEASRLLDDEVTTMYALLSAVKSAQVSELLEFANRRTHVSLDPASALTELDAIAREEGVARLWRQLFVAEDTLYEAYIDRLASKRHALSGRRREAISEGFARASLIGRDSLTQPRLVREEPEFRYSVRELRGPLLARLAARWAAWRTRHAAASELIIFLVWCASGLVFMIAGYATLALFLEAFG
ncbi:hypothetical protein J2S49_000155 [Arcanobacterium wilhelmae]|uniref:DUF5129 domain-containing protein n=1 Tax=Arcanobacterium wilhelmae TaxID=1803177 RepID=A0ABT9N8P7_9ACTO|nr:hypothetical protein [Arcanobacterium wilhelmae]MDP9800079.1 hypothetical protein [Arcanobacterium wilhelmae]